ncbi:MAG: cyanophycin synthetase, partial [Gemmatimonadota bacterium]
ARTRARRVVTAGLTAADCMPSDLTIDSLGRASFSADGHRVVLPYPGRHLAANAMLAWALVRELALDPAAAASNLGTLVIPGGRSELTQHGGLTILNDCYNANPQSFASAIGTAQAMRAGRRLVFVAGTMRELGAASAQLHADVAQDLVALAPDLIAVVGEFAAALAPYAAELGDRLLVAPDAPALGPLLARRLRGDEVIVLKASRGVALERILPLLLQPTPTSSEV